MEIKANYIRFYVIEFYFIGYIRDYNNTEVDSDISIPFEDTKIVGIYFSENAAKTAFDNFDIYEHFTNEELLDADEITVYLQEWNGYEDSEAEDRKLISKKIISPKDFIK